MNYYARLILLITETLALSVGIVKYTSLGNLKVFIWYLTIDLSLFITSILIDTLRSLSVPQIHVLNESINLSVSLIEVIVYFIYFKKEMRIRNIIKYMLPVLFIIVAYITVKYAFGNSTGNTTLLSASYFFSTVAFLIISPLAFISMLDLLKENKTEAIHRTPRFWITVGILYYSTISIPFYFFRGFFDMQRDVKVLLDTVLFYTPFTLNLMCILIAFVCKKQLKN